MKLERVTIENYRAIARLELRLHPRLTVLHGDNGHGKTSVLAGIAVGLGSIPERVLEMALGPNLQRNHPDFLDSDFRKDGEPKVALTTTDGAQWHRRRSRPGRGTSESPNVLGEAIPEIVYQDKAELWPMRDLPIVAFYDTERATGGVRKPAQSSRFDNPGGRLIRYLALDGSLAPHTDFQAFFDWFYDREKEELREQRERRSFDYSREDLDAVRGAIERMLPGVSRPRVEQVGADRIRFLVSEASESGEARTLALDQMSGGYRIMLALVADLARRMAQGNPHLEDPLQSEAVALIDEVDLHLHPSWQQRALPDLMRTFPNAQFIVSTHSPQVLTTVKPENIVRLRRDGDSIVATGTGGPTYGAEAGYALAVEMGVQERPPAKHNEFVALLEQYNHLVNYGQGKSEEARQLRGELERLSPRDFALDRADSEMRRQNVMQRLAESKRLEEVR